MASFNKVILMGNLTRDPQLKYLPSKTAVCEFGIAVNRKWRTQDGKDGEETSYFECQCWGKTAETFNEYMAKGRPVLLEGRLKQDRWTGTDDKPKSVVRIQVESFQFIGNKPESQKPAEAPERPVTSEPEDDYGPF